MLSTYIPLLLLVILHSIIFINLKTQAHPGEQSTNNQQQRKRRNRSVQMSIASVTLFVLCLLPFITNHLIIEYQVSAFVVQFLDISLCNLLFDSRLPCYQPDYLLHV